MMKIAMKTEDALNWLAEVFEEQPGRIKADTLRTEIPTWDSLGTLTLIAGLDEKFDIHLSETDIESMQKFADVLDILRRNGKLDD